MTNFLYCPVFLLFVIATYFLSEVEFLKKTKRASSAPRCALRIQESCYIERSSPTNAHVNMLVCVRAGVWLGLVWERMSVCEYTNVCACALTHMYVGFVCLYVCVYVCICVCACVVCVNVQKVKIRHCQQTFGIIVHRGRL